jgi:hypothetical protein
MLPDTGIDDVKKQRNAEYAKHINDPVLSSLKMESICLLFFFPFFLVLTCFCLLILGLEGYCFTWLHSLTPHTHTHKHIGYDCPGRMIGPSQRTLPDNRKQPQKTSMSPSGLEPAVPAVERSQTHALDRASTGFGAKCIQFLFIIILVSLTTISVIT